MAEQTAVPERIRKITPSAEDRARLSRLYEEVMGRQTEMALIIARVLGDNREGSLFAFSLPIQFPWARIAGSKAVRNFLCGFNPDGGVTTLPPTIQCNVHSDGGVDCGGYNDSTGTCEPIDHSES